MWASVVPIFQPQEQFSPMKIHFTPLRVLLAAMVAIITTVPAQADQQYSNVTTFGGQGYAPGGATSNGSFFITSMVADDLTLAAGSAGQAVTGFTFSVANFNGSAVSARPSVFFYADNGSSGAPGTLLASFTLNATSFTANSVALFTDNPGSPLFLAPSSGRMWAGVVFDNSGTAASGTQLNNLGQGIFNPPTIGSSADIFFQTTPSGSFPGNNPPGGFGSFGGNPPANFGWRIFGDVAATPEGGSTVLFLMLGLSGLVLAQRRMRSAR